VSPPAFLGFFANVTIMAALAENPVKNITAYEILPFFFDYTCHRLSCHIIIC
jgi:hypothetical protein